MPLTTNSLYAHTGRYRFMTSKGKDNKEAIALEARQQYRGKPLVCLLKVKIALWWGDKRKRDIDNIKVLLDALTSILWVDDSQIIKLEIAKGYDKENPRVEMEVTTVKGVDNSLVRR